MFIMLTFLALRPSQLFFVPKIFSESPSFVRQEIIDANDDWIFWNNPSPNKVAIYNDKDNLVEVEKAIF